ncbi:MAG: M23 family metallopeptidase [Ruminococcaceae bacterium]|nr:M23 family metallopeptidase [Oscillospiraceae bacterium]
MKGNDQNRNTGRSGEQSRKTVVRSTSHGQRVSTGSERASGNAPKRPASSNGTGYTRKKKKKLRKWVVYLIVLVVLSIPAFIAYNFIKELLSDNIEASQLVRVEFSYNGGEEVYESEEDLQRFADLINNAEHISDPARDLAEYKKMSLKVSKIAREFKYDIYLSDSAYDCLIVDDNGECYRIDKENAMKLLLMDELDYIYENPSLPSFTVLTDARKNKLVPYEYDWHYRIADGEYRTTEEKNEKAAEESDTIVISDDIKLSVDFDVAPDWLYIKLYNESGSVIYEGSIDGIGSYGYDKDVKLKGEITAKWYEDTSGAEDAKKYHGNLKLCFNAIYDKAVSCELSSYSVNPGELVILKMVNGEEENFTIKSDIITTETIELFDYNGARYALIPIACENASGNKTIRVTSERGTENVLKLYVSSKEFNALTVDSTKYGCTPSEYNNSYASFKKLLASLDEEVIQEKLWSGIFVYPTSDKTTWIDTRFGAVWSVLGTNGKIRCPGIIYAANSSGERIAASNNGKIVFAGEHAYSGNTVVIDHGFGIKTVYYYLDSISVSVGDTVTKGQSVGTLGKSGYSTKNSVMFAVFANGVCINPYYPCANGIEMLGK